MVSASTLQKMSSSEHLYPFLLAAIEACIVNVVCVGLANIGFLGSTDALIPLWLPFLLIATACWITRYPTQRLQHTFPALQQQENERGYPQPLLALLLTLIILELLFFVCATIYAPLLDISWLTDTPLLSAVRIIIVLAIAIFLCWRGIQIARSRLDTDAIGRILRIVVVCLALILVQRVVQELLYHDEIAHEDIALFFLVTLFACLSLFAYPLAQRVYLLRFSTENREVFKKQEYVLLCGTALFYLFALLSLWYVIFLYNHWIVVGTRLGAKYLPKVAHQTPKVPTSKGSPEQLDLPVFPWLRVAFFVALTLLIIALVLWAVRRLLAHRSDDIHESLWSWALFWRQLKAFTYDLFTRFFSFQKEDKVGEPPRVEKPVEVSQVETVQRTPTMHPIRELYRTVLQYAKSAGYPRSRSETPDEFCRRLSQHFPFAEPQLELITHAYIATRYGQSIPDETEIVRLRDAWGELERRWQEDSE